ncbi:polysaccharide export protein [Parahaliea maris]|uniref:Polysaccharide export protein n=1 Tax=Parahaliea maris TaxID=2716870 RepID=A0A5C8ZQ26_9GAMM|nr:polysaccharide biosynthesis/export family protein [Parahaliea maris]TXS89904.1 polysaccharide export protein [Parahaliea maris]
MNRFYFRLLSLLTTLLLLAPGLSVQAATSPGVYRLGAGDHILIQVFDEPDLSMNFSLNDSGIVNYPLLGEILVEGLTVKELEDRITTGLRGDYLVSPDVTVSIEEYRPIFINGEVKQPGGFPYQPGLTVQKAVALAGGFTERAQRKGFALQRAADPEDELTVGLGDTVMPGDIITVKRSFF